MITVVVLFLLTVFVLLAVFARQGNPEKSFRLLSSLPPVLFAGSLIASRYDGNSLSIYAVFCLSLLLSFLGLGFGATLTILRKKSGASIDKLALLTLWAGSPALYAIFKKLIF